MLLELVDPATNSRWEEIVKPISLGQENQLLYQRWVDTRREKNIGTIGWKTGVCACSWNERPKYACRD